MKDPISQYCLRMARSAYEDAVDISLVFGMSMNQFMVGAIQQYVQAQLEQESIRSAVQKVREARQAGLARVLVTALAGGSVGPAAMQAIEKRIESVTDVDCTKSID